jgi:hypothetical protein
VNDDSVTILGKMSWPDRSTALAQCRTTTNMNILARAERLQLGNLGTQVVVASQNFVNFGGECRMECRCQLQRGIRRGSGAALLLGLRVRIPPGAWMCLCSECCVSSGRGL